MKSKIIKSAFIILSLTALITACGAPAAQAPTQAPVQPSIEAPTEAPQATAAPVATEAATEAPTAEAAVVIQHHAIPVNFPAAQSAHAGDYDSSITAKKKFAASGDRFTFGYFERPFNANSMDQYFQNLDIVDAFVFDDGNWIYGKIVLKGAQTGDAGKYALEIDLDRDGKGDWLIVAANPASTDWATDGVKAYQDANKDVGNSTPIKSDSNAANGDGFESLTTNDPDAVWARTSPEDPNTVEIAVKRSLLGNPTSYMISMWAGSSLLDPALFDLNDHFTHEQAGAADMGFEIFYPIKQVAEIDNTCRMVVGFTPTGLEPGLCNQSESGSGIAGSTSGDGDGGNGGCIPSRTSPCP